MIVERDAVQYSYAHTNQHNYESHGRIESTTLQPQRRRHSNDDGLHDESRVAVADLLRLSSFREMFGDDVENGERVLLCYHSG